MANRFVTTHTTKSFSLLQWALFQDYYNMESSVFVVVNIGKCATSKPTVIIHSFFLLAFLLRQFFLCLRRSFLRKKSVNFCSKNIPPLPLIVSDQSNQFTLIELIASLKWFSNIVETKPFFIFLTKMKISASVTEISCRNTKKIAKGLLPGYIQIQFSVFLVPPTNT